MVLPPVYVSDMSVRRVATWVLLGSIFLACGERAGDAVVALPAAGAPAGGGSGGNGTSSPAFEDDAGGAAGSPAEASTSGPAGLCAPCSRSRECGDSDDLCILHGVERFCGRDCQGQSDCPDGYSCVALSNSPLLQCAPDETCPALEEAPPALGDVRAYVLARINAERLAEGRDPLAGSDCLDELAQGSAVDFAWTDAPFGKFREECQPIWPSCACGWRGEAELSMARLGLDWRAAVDRAVSTPPDEATEVFAAAYLSATVTDVGIGFWLSGDEAWLALSFR